MSEMTNDNDLQTSPTNRRPMKTAHLVFGLIFLGIAGVWALTSSGVMEWDLSLSVVLPTILVAAGVIGLIATAVSGVNRRREEIR